MSLSDRIVIRRERPDPPAVMAQLAKLHTDPASLHEPEATHILHAKAP